jgi:hypothetical protein
MADGALTSGTNLFAEELDLALAFSPNLDGVGQTVLGKSILTDNAIAMPNKAANQPICNSFSRNVTLLVRARAYVSVKASYLVTFCPDITQLLAVSLNSLTWLIVRSCEASTLFRAVLTSE